MRRSPLPSLLVAVLASACAERQQLPPGNELEFPEAAARPSPTALDVSKPADHDAIASAFSPAREPAERKPKADTPRAHFQDVMQASEDKLNAADMLEARGAYEELVAKAEAAGPEAEQALHQERFAACRHNGDSQGALEAAERWLKACGPARTDACRTRALSAWALAAQGPDRAIYRTRIAAYRKHDACVARAESEPRASHLSCLSAAKTFYDRETDALMLQRALVAKAKLERGAAAAQTFAEADRACGEPRCLAPERRLLREATRRSLKRRDARLGLQLAQQDARLAFGSLSAEQALVAHTALLNEACAAVDAREGAGTCKRAEKELVKRTLSDEAAYAAGHAEGLAPDAVKAVNERFNAFIQECLADEAERLEPPESAHYGVTWVVLNDGRVDQVHLDRKDRDEGPLAQCLRAQFALWRYPSYRGELQHVEQRFVVSARERRPVSVR